MIGGWTQAKVGGGGVKKPFRVEHLGGGSSDSIGREGDRGVFKTILTAHSLRDSLTEPYRKKKRGSARLGETLETSMLSLEFGRGHLIGG